MKLVKKGNNQIAVRSLSLNASKAIQNVFGDERSSSQRDDKISKIVIGLMDRNSLYIECDCLPTGNKQPLNCEVEKTFIRRVKSSPEHDPKCPLYHLRRRKQEDAKEGRGGTISPLLPVDINDIFTRKVIEHKSGSGTGQPQGRQRRSALKPVPALGRLLFTLLDGAGLTTMQLLPVKKSRGLTNTLIALSTYIRSVTLKNGVAASKIITTRINLTPVQQNQMMASLERKDVEWDEGREREFFLVGYTEHLEEQKVIFRLKGLDLPPFQTAKPIKTFGETLKNIGTKAPYWVILRFRRGDNGKVYCDEGYAHCAYKKHNPIPVDSEKERATLGIMEDAAKYVLSQPAKSEKGLPLVIVKKPLFTSTVTGEDGNAMEVHPDFLIELQPAGSQHFVNLVVETMGYDSPEYMERKHRTHPGMSQLGYLMTDPHGYPAKSNRSFRQELLSCIFQPERHR